MQLHGCHIKTQRPAPRVSRVRCDNSPWQTAGRFRSTARPEDLWRDRTHLMHVHFGETDKHDYISDREAVTRAIKAADGALRFKCGCSTSCQHDAEEVLGLAVPALQADREIVLLAVQRCGKALRYASPELRDDIDIALAAITQDPRSIQFASYRVRSDRTVAIQAVLRSGNALQHVATCLRDDFGVVVAALSTDLPPLQVSSHPSVRHNGVDCCWQQDRFGEEQLEPETKAGMNAPDLVQIESRQRRRRRQRQKAEQIAAAITSAGVVAAPCISGNCEPSREQQMRAALCKSQFLSPSPQSCYCFARSNLPAPRPSGKCQAAAVFCTRAKVGAWCEPRCTCKTLSCFRVWDKRWSTDTASVAN
eukprot:COSAG02_NODE_1641_length_11530_cov_4.345289_12_plen_364_part_00